MSSNFQMFVQVLLKFIAFPVLYLSLLKTENIKENGGLKRSRTLWSPSPAMSSACLSSVENFSLRINLIREVRNVGTKENSQRRLIIMWSLSTAKDL